LALWAVRAILTGDYLASDPNDVVPKNMSLDAVVSLLSRPVQVVNSSKHAYSPPSRQPYWLSLEEINQCRLCLRFHGISGFVTPWAHQDGLIEGDCLTQSRLGSSRAGHYIYDPVECWNGYYPLSTSSLPLSFPYMGVNL